jgi:hypothetical protein
MGVRSCNIIFNMTWIHTFYTIIFNSYGDSPLITVFQKTKNDMNEILIAPFTLNLISSYITYSIGIFL